LKVLDQGDFDLVEFIVSIMYMEKFIRGSHMTLHICMWRGIFISCLQVARKMLRDKRGSECKVLTAVVTTAPETEGVRVCLYNLSGSIVQESHFHKGATISELEHDIVTGGRVGWTILADDGRMVTKADRLEEYCQLTLTNVVKSLERHNSSLLALFPKLNIKHLHVLEASLTRKITRDGPHLFATQDDFDHMCSQLLAETVDPGIMDRVTSVSFPSLTQWVAEEKSDGGVWLFLLYMPP